MSDLLIPDPRRLRVWLLWTLQILAAVAFIASGLAKLAGAAPMVMLYDEIGLGQWFRHVTGIIELGGALALLIPRLAVCGAGLLICVMIGAVVTHVFVVGGSPLPAMLLLTMLAGAAWMRRHEISFR